MKVVSISGVRLMNLLTDSFSTVLSPTADHTFSFNGPSPPRIEFDYDDPNGMSEYTRRGQVTTTSFADYMYPSYDPFEDQECDYGTYEDVDEALAIIGRRSQRKRYMVGLFPGVNESFLQRDVIRESLRLVPFYEACNV